MTTPFGRECRWRQDTNSRHRCVVKSEAGASEGSVPLSSFDSMAPGAVDWCIRGPGTNNSDRGLQNTWTACTVARITAAPNPDHLHQDSERGGRSSHQLVKQVDLLFPFNACSSIYFPNLTATPDLNNWERGMYLNATFTSSLHALRTSFGWKRYFVNYQDFAHRSGMFFFEGTRDTYNYVLSPDAGLGPFGCVNLSITTPLSRARGSNSE